MKVEWSFRSGAQLVGSVNICIGISDIEASMKEEGLTPKALWILQLSPVGALRSPFKRVNERAMDRRVKVRTLCKSSGIQRHAFASERLREDWG